MTIGYFSRAFNFKHKSLSTKTHIVNNNKVLCGYKPHKTLNFLWCAFLSDGIDNLQYLECNKCKDRYVKLLKRRIKNDN